MISFDLPANFNGEQFCKELENAGINLNHKEDMYATSDGVLWLNIQTKDTQKVQESLNAHIPKPVNPPTVAEKLASVGLSLDDLKTALGL